MAIAPPVLREDQSADGTVTLTLNRPGRRKNEYNALNGELIAALTEAYTRLGANSAVSAIVLRAAKPQGPHFTKAIPFCSGVDMEWMLEKARGNACENLQDARNLANMFDVISQCKKPTIAVLEGSASCAGMGIASCCDYVIGTAGSQFRITDLALGIRPATTSPHLIRRIGVHNMKVLCATMKRISAPDMHNAGLLNEMVVLENVEKCLAEALCIAKTGGKEALSSCRNPPQNVDIEIPGDCPHMEFTEPMRNIYKTTLRLLDDVDKTLGKAKDWQVFVESDDWKLLKENTARDLARRRAVPLAISLLEKYTTITPSLCAA